MSFDWSDAIAILALVLSVLAFYQSSRHRTGDLEITRLREGAALIELILPLKKKPAELREGWRAALASATMLESGLAATKEQIADELQIRVDEVIAEFEANESQPYDIERDVGNIYFLRARADALAKDIETEEAKLARFIDELRDHRK